MWGDWGRTPWGRGASQLVGPTFVALACGETTRTADPHGASGSGGSASSVGIGGSGGTWAGTSESCGRASHRLEGCYALEPAAAGAPGIGGSHEVPEISACWGADAPDDCEATFEGRVLGTDATFGPEWCDGTLFGGLTNASANAPHWLSIGTDELSMVVSLGRDASELDVAPGDTVRARLLRQTYHQGLMRGTRLTLTSDGAFLAVLNDGLPIDEPINFGALKFSRGHAVCAQPEDSASCTNFAHHLVIEQHGGGHSLSPGSSSRFDGYKVIVGENFVVRDGGSCHDGDVTNLLIVRVPVEGD